MTAHVTQPRLTALRATICTAALALLCTRCVASVDDGTAAPEQLGSENGTIDVAAAEQALINGTRPFWLMDLFSGVVALQFMTSPGNYATFCSGALSTNNKVVTANHCLGDWQGRAVYASMGNGTQRMRVIGWWQHPTADMAVLKLESGMAMPNWTLDHYATDPIEINTHGYARAMYQGSNESLNGVAMACYGYGGAEATPPLSYSIFHGLFPSGWKSGSVEEVLLLGTDDAVRSVEGDSGGPCLLGPAAPPTFFVTWEATLAVVDSHFAICVGCGAGPGAASWYPQAALAIYFL